MVSGTKRSKLARTFLINSSLSVTRTDAATSSCSAWLIKSAATKSGFAESSAKIAISVGPASESIPIRPLSIRFAAVTYMLPGPVTKYTGSISTSVAP